MAEAATQETAETPAAPATPMFPMSEHKAAAKYLADSTGDEMPRLIESIEELEPQDLLKPPYEITERYPERYYRWEAMDLLERKLATMKGMWKPVTRSNHSNLPDRIFDMATGLVLFDGGQNALIFTLRQNMDLMTAKKTQSFDLKYKKNYREMETEYINPATGNVAVVKEELAPNAPQGPIMNQRMIEDPNEQYDYSEE